MKKIFTIIVVAFAFCFTSTELKAQYMQQTSNAKDSYTENRVKCYQAELQKAMEQESRGRNTFFTGLAVQIVGAAGLYVSATNDAEVLTTLSYITIAAGSITEIIGLSNWYGAAMKIRNLSLAYGTINGGVGAAVVF